MKDIQDRLSDALASLLPEKMGLPDWKYMDLPRTTEEIFNEFVELVGEENIKWVTKAKYKNGDRRGQILLSPAGAERIEQGLRDRGIDPEELKGSDCDCMVCRGESDEAFYERTRKNIEEYGISGIGVGYKQPEEDGVPFMYTIGNTEKGWPEFLLVARIPYEVAGAMVNELSKKLRENNAPLGDLVDLGGKYPVKLVKVTSDEVKEEYTVQVGRYYDGKQDYEVVQVLLPDRQGLYPDERKGKDYLEQPILT